MPIELNKKEAERRIAKVNEALRAGYPSPDLASHGLSAIGRAADALGIKRNSFSMSLKSIQHTHKLSPDWSLYKAPTIDERIEAAQQRDVVDELRSKIEELETELVNQKTVREHAFELAEAETTPPSWLIEQGTPGAMTGVPVLQVTDLQWGEQIDASELDGINSFNIKTAEQRYRKLINGALDLCFNHMVAPKYPGMVYLRGGDMVHGDVLRLESRLNEKGVLHCTTSLVRAERWGIEALADKFGHVCVITTPGNHGRTTMKPESMRAAEENYDTLSHLMLEQAFEDDERVTFLEPRIDVVVNIMGMNVLFTHGDRIGSKGGQGFVGAAATISRGMKKLVDYYAALGIVVHLIMVGHFHEPLELEYGFSGGSLPGYSEFARDIRARPKQAKQWLIFIHPKYGVTCRWQVFLSPPMKRAADSEGVAKLKWGK